MDLDCIMGRGKFVPEKWFGYPSSVLIYLFIIFFYTKENKSKWILREEGKGITLFLIK